MRHYRPCAAAADAGPVCTEATHGAPRHTSGPRSSEQRRLDLRTQHRIGPSSRDDCSAWRRHTHTARAARPWRPPRARAPARAALAATSAERAASTVASPRRRACPCARHPLACRRTRVAASSPHLPPTARRRWPRRRAPRRSAAASSRRTTAARRRRATDSTAAGPAATRCCDAPRRTARTRRRRAVRCD